MGDNVQFQVLNRGEDQKKNEYLGGEEGDKKSSFQIFAWGYYSVSGQKNCKIKYGFEDSVSNVDFGMSQLPKVIKI